MKWIRVLVCLATVPAMGANYAGLHMYVVPQQTWGPGLSGFGLVPALTLGTGDLWFVVWGWSTQTINAPWPEVVSWNITTKFAPTLTGIPLISLKGGLSITASVQLDTSQATTYTSLVAGLTLFVHAEPTHLTWVQLGIDLVYGQGYAPFLAIGLRW